MPQIQPQVIDLDQYRISKSAVGEAVDRCLHQMLKPDTMHLFSSTIMRYHAVYTMRFPKYQIIRQGNIITLRARRGYRA